MSHTIQAKIELRNREALARAVTHLGGAIKGEGTYSFFSSREVGFGFHLPRWRFPIVLRDDGTVAFDDYKGQWGNRADIDTLRSRYAIEAARCAAEAQGWYCEEQGEALMIYYPEGGTLTVSPSGEVDASSFIGPGCADATEIIASALGQKQAEYCKPEFFAERAHIHQDE